jgi:hypothetical protein
MKNKYLFAGLLLSALAINAQSEVTSSKPDTVEKAVVDVKNTTTDLANKAADVTNEATNLVDTKVAITNNNSDLKDKTLELTKQTVSDTLTPTSKPEPTQEKVNLETDISETTTKVEEIKKLKPLTKTTTTTVVKELNLVGATQHNWWKWLGLLALLGALLGFLAATFKRRDHEKETNNSPRKNRHSDREVEFTFEEEKENKTSDKRNHNNDFKNRD